MLGTSATVGRVRGWISGGDLACFRCDIGLVLLEHEHISVLFDHECAGGEGILST